MIHVGGAFETIRNWALSGVVGNLAFALLGAAAAALAISVPYRRRAQFLGVRRARSIVTISPSVAHVEMTSAVGERTSRGFLGASVPFKELVASDAIRAAIEAGPLHRLGVTMSTILGRASFHVSYSYFPYGVELPSPLSGSHIVIGTRVNNQLAALIDDADIGSTKAPVKFAWDPESAVERFDVDDARFADHVLQQGDYDYGVVQRVSSPGLTMIQVAGLGTTATLATAEWLAREYAHVVGEWVACGRQEGFAMLLEFPRIHDQGVTVALGVPNATVIESARPSTRGRT